MDRRKVLRQAQHERGWELRAWEMSETLALVDYGAGNIRSVENALKAAGADGVVVTADPSVVRTADRIVLPGVGAFRHCIGALVGVPGLVVATGLSGHGFGIGPGLGRVVADLVAGRSVGHDLTRFRLSRFSDGSATKAGPSL